MRRLLSFLTLFTAAGTLVCCALPALFVTLGLGAAFAGLVIRVPQLIWISEHKFGVFIVGAFFLILGGVAQRHASYLPCPIDPEQAKACASARAWSTRIYLAAIFIYIGGAAFAFGGRLLAL